MVLSAKRLKCLAISPAMRFNVPDVNSRWLGRRELMIKAVSY